MFGTWGILYFILVPIDTYYNDMTVMQEKEEHSNHHAVLNAVFLGHAEILII